MKYVVLILRNVRRNPLRSILATLVTMVLVLVVTMVWSILTLLDLVTTEKSENFRAMVTERWSIPSRMPFAYAHTLGRGAARKAGDPEPTDSMTWQFFPGSVDVDPKELTRDSLVFCCGVEPSKVLTMMEGLDSLPPHEEVLLEQYVDQLTRNRQGIILGQNHLRKLNKRIGERITLYGVANFKGLTLEFDIIGVFPPGRYDTLAVFHRDYINNEMDAYPRKNNGREHPLAGRNLNIVWLKFPDMATFRRVAAQIESSPYFTNPAVKCETAASGFSSFLEGFRDLVWGMRWLLSPACLFTILLVIANAISISVRERRLELAVMKVLGFRPWQLMLLVLGESLLLGAGAGFLSSAGTYLVVNHVMGGISFPVGFFDRFLIPIHALWWGPAIGGLAALLGSFLPAWSAQKVKVADVFAKIA
ncbi:MAG: ABC transporter permease [Planctomycetota bacterium]